MRVAIVTVATGPYVKLLPRLCQSVDEKFLFKHERQVFVFSDTAERAIRIDHLPATLNSLFKPFYINRIREQLKKFDFVYYIDSDCEVVDGVDEDVFADTLVATLHPLKRPEENHFETNPKSTAFVPNSDGRPYYQACFYGGSAPAVLELSEYCEALITEDLRNKIIGKWFDEPYFNKYLTLHSPKVLHGGYAYPDPEQWADKWPFPAKIVHYNCHTHKRRLQ